MRRSEGCALVENIAAPETWIDDELQFVDRVLQGLSLPFGWQIRAAYDGGRVFIQVRCSDGVDNVTGGPIMWLGRKWLLSRHMTAGEIAQTVLKATLTAAEHEIRELLTYQGAAIFDPHYDVEKLVELRRRPDALKERGGS